MTYNWQQKEWPNFTYDLTEVQQDLIAFAHSQGKIRGMLEALPVQSQQQSMIDAMVEEALRSFEIEGEFLSRQDVLSSIRNQLGLNRQLESIRDKRAAGVAKLMIHSRNHFAAPLTKEMLFEWHQLIMEPYLNIQIGQWRKGKEPMQIVSGSIGKEEVHFEAPASEQVPYEMDTFIQWFNQTEPGHAQEINHAPIRSGIAHLYFESIHPFEDGNGRIGRALSEKALSQGLGHPILLSLSKTINQDRKGYYAALKKAQRSNEITPWLQYFLSALLKAQEDMKAQIHFTILKTRFFDHLEGQLNPRQEKVIDRMLEAGPSGFEGGMNAKKYMSITKSSKATATRDLQQLTALGALQVIGKGRNTRYQLNFDLLK